MKPEDENLIAEYARKLIQALEEGHSQTYVTAAGEQDVKKVMAELWLEAQRRKGEENCLK